MEALTRKHFRERIRHNLGKRTLRDNDPNAELGEPAATHPHPTNVFLNEKIDEALRFLNSECDLGFVDDVEVSVSASTADGAQRILLHNVAPTLYSTEVGDAGDIHTVKRAYLEVGDTLYPLIPVDREEYDRSRRQWEIEDAGTPRYLWREGNALYLLPGTNTAGTLHITAGTGIIGFRTDADTLLQLPNDFHSVAVDAATWHTAMSEPNNVEMQTQAGLYRLKVWGDGRGDIGGIGRIRRWKRGQTGEMQAGLYVRTGRVPVGRRG